MSRQSWKYTAEVEQVACACCGGDTLVLAFKPGTEVVCDPCEQAWTEMTEDTSEAG